MHLGCRPRLLGYVSGYEDARMLFLKCLLVFLNQPVLSFFFFFFFFLLLLLLLLLQRHFDEEQSRVEAREPQGQRQRDKNATEVPLLMQ